MSYIDLPSRSARFQSFFLIVAVAALLAISVVFSFLAVASNDDFCRGTLSVSWLEKVIKNYYEWSGRWAVHALYSLIFPRIGITSINYNLLVSTSLPIWFSIFYLQLAICLGAVSTSRQRIGISLVLCAVYWAGMPKVGETWYWLTGSIEYNLPFLLLSILLYIVAVSLPSVKTSRTEYFLASAASLLAIVIGGLNELISLILIPTIGAGTVALVVKKKGRLAKLYGAVLTSGIVGFAFNVLAPGTSGHAADFPNPYSLKAAIQASLFRQDSFPLDWFVDSRLLCLSVLLLSSRWFVRLSPSWTRLTLFGFPPVFIIPTFGLLVVFGVWVLGAFAQGSSPSGRMLNILYAFFVMIWFFTMTAAAEYVRAAFDHSADLLSRANMVAGFLFPLSLLVSPTMTLAAFELRYVSLPWHQAVERRDSYVRTSVNEGNREIELTPIPYRPQMFFWQDLESQPGHWRNACYAKYYGADQISVAMPSVPRSSSVKDPSGY
jgi:hypothetical protein